MSTLTGSTSPEPSPDDERRIVAVDATMICVPGDKKNYYLLHTAYDVTAQCFRSTDITDRHTAGRLDGGKIERDEIRLGDRAYARWRDLWTVIEAGADYVCGLSATALKLYTVSGEPIRRAVWCKLAETAGVQNVTLAIHATKGAAQMLVRLIVLPFSEEKCGGGPAADAQERPQVGLYAKPGRTCDRGLPDADHFAAARSLAGGARAHTLSPKMAG